MQRRNKWKDIYTLIKSKGEEVYSPGQKNDICKNRYVVIKESGTYPSTGSNKIGYSLMEIIVYYPLNQYSEIDGFKEKLKLFMKELKGIKPTGNETPIIVDDGAKAYTLSIEYQIHKKLQGSKYVGEIDEEKIEINDEVDLEDTDNINLHSYDFVSSDEKTSENNYI